jgi:hypothetical protein
MPRRRRFTRIDDAWVCRCPESPAPHLKHAPADAPARPAVMIWCRCVGCGAEALLRHVVGAQYLEPVGWAAFSAAFWPAGSEDRPTLYLRLCGACFEAARGTRLKSPPKPPFKNPEKMGTSNARTRGSGNK